jgi:hypothetical protein
MQSRQPERLNIGDELVRSPLHPEPRRPFAWNGVVGAVDLDYRELTGIEAQTVFGGLRSRRVNRPLSIKVFST